MAGKARIREMPVAIGTGSIECFDKRGRSRLEQSPAEVRGARSRASNRHHEASFDVRRWMTHISHTTCFECATGRSPTCRLRTSADYGFHCLSLSLLPAYALVVVSDRTRPLTSIVFMSSV